MKTNDAPSPTSVALELELELRRSGEQLRDSRERLRDAEHEAAAALISAQRTGGVFKALSSVARAGLEIVEAQGAAGVLDGLDRLTQSEVEASEETLGLLRTRGRSMSADEAALDRELASVRSALLRMKDI